MAGRIYATGHRRARENASPSPQKNGEAAPPRADGLAARAVRKEPYAAAFTGTSSGLLATSMATREITANTPAA